MVKFSMSFAVNERANVGGTGLYFALTLTKSISNRQMKVSLLWSPEVQGDM